MNRAVATLSLLLLGCSTDWTDHLAPGPDQPDRSGGLTNVGTLDDILEHGSLGDACTRWSAGQTDPHTTLLCGKQMFFYETFGTAGIPADVVKIFVSRFPKSCGAGYAQLGMFEDPSSADHLPLGLAPGKSVSGTSAPGVAFTCASCHLGRLPDGRFSVGAPNHGYEYGKQILGLVLAPTLILGVDTATHDGAAIAAIQPVIDEAAADPTLRDALLQAVLPLVGGTMPKLTVDDEGFYGAWRAGTQDFVIAPLPIDDKVHTVSKITALWGIEDTAASSMLGWTGVASSVKVFLRGFVLLGGGDVSAWPDDRLAPLAAYVQSLDAPPSPHATDDHGRAIFNDHCASCHDGPRGGGRRLFTYDELGTDAEMKKWLDPDGTGQACCGIAAPSDQPLTGKLKAPRLQGLWAQTRFLHDGALDSLEQLLCVTARPGVTMPAFSDGGHRYGCDLGASDKTALLGYLRAH